VRQNRGEQTPSLEKTSGRSVDKKAKGEKIKASEEEIPERAKENNGQSSKVSDKKKRFLGEPKRRSLHM